MQQLTTLGTAHILRKVPSIKPDKVTGQDIQHNASPMYTEITLDKTW